MWTRVWIVALCVSGAVGYGNYRYAIPNGDHVPHPCKPNYIWHGVGHQAAAGGGARNPFGQDFAANGHRWTSSLCRMDSDGDGMTNGQELGDPDCTWTTGQSPRITTGISHPGVCEPMNSAVCATRNTWVDCTSDTEFKCDAVKQPDVRNMTIRFPRTKVPAQETSYYCFNFELPSDQEYHLIATEAIIDNANVMHHMVLSTCSDQGRLLPEPQNCLMGVEGCADIMSIWTLGLAGECINPKVGFRFGKGATKMLSLQQHWTNPSLEEDYTDSSGLVLYYTPKLRQYNAGVMTVGQVELTIPPGQASVTHMGSCTAECTKSLLTGDIHILSAFNHMHYLGISQNSTLTRPGQAPMVVTDDDPYSYDSPKIYGFDNPLEVNPGDELTTFCTYQSRSRSEVTTFGPGSFEEMCFLIFTYYPVENVETNTCFQLGENDMCPGGENSCDFVEVFDPEAPATAAMLKKIWDNCDISGSKCLSGCPAAVREVMQDNVCFFTYADYVLDDTKNSDDARWTQFLAGVMSCDGKAESTTKPTSHSESPKTQSGTGAGAMFMDIIKQLDSRPLLQNIIMNVNYNYDHAPHKDDMDQHSELWH